MAILAIFRTRISVDLAKKHGLFQPIWEALFTFSVSFRPTAERSSAASVSLAIAKAIPSSAAAASEAPRLAEILPEKVNKAIWELGKINALTQRWISNGSSNGSGVVWLSYGKMWRDKKEVVSGVRN